MDEFTVGCAFGRWKLVRLTRAVCAAVAFMLLASCAVQDRLVEVSDRHAARQYANDELKYAGYELSWPGVEDGDEDLARFREDFEEHLEETLARRMPRFLKGGRGVVIEIGAAELRNPNALERAMFQDPSVRIDVVFRDAATGEALLAYSERVVDRLAPDPSGGISFRVGAISGRLAGAVVGNVVSKLSDVEWLRKGAANLPESRESSDDNGLPDQTEPVPERAP